MNLVSSNVRFEPLREENAAMNGSRRVRVGILGCSDVARRKFIPALKGSRTAELAAVAGRNREQAEAVISGGVGCVCSYEDLIASPDVELVYLSLPNHLHEEWTIRALAGGKHVICEKPLGLSRSAVERMLAIAEERGLLLFENLMFLHHPQHAAVKELIDGGLVGRVTAVRSVFGFPLPGSGNFRLDPSQGGGAFHDLSRYPLGTALYFLAGDSYEFRGFAIDRQGLTVAMYGQALTNVGENFSFAMAFGQQYESYYEIVGEKGKIRVDRAYTPPADLANRIQVICGTEELSFLVPPADQFQLMIDRVSTLVRGNDDFRAVHDETRKLACLAERMEKGCVYG